MSNDKLPAYQPYPSSPILPSYTALPPVRKRVPRNQWILFGIALFVMSFTWFSPRVTVYTWRATPDEFENHVVEWNPAMAPGGRLGVWQGEIFDANLDRANHFRNGLPLGMEDEALRWMQEFSRPPSAQTIHNDLQGLPEVHNSSPEDRSDNYPQPMAGRIVQKVAPLQPAKPLSPLPSFPLRPDMVYENVRPSPHGLTGDPQQSRFLTYLPHSGFHNQRIEIMNAFKLAKLLNRTLILPELRLGRALSWRDSKRLAHDLQYEMKYQHFDCVASSVKRSTPKDCESYADWTPVQVDYMLNITALVEEQPVIDRVDLRENWLWETLQLGAGDWVEVTDDTRYSYQIFESEKIDADLQAKYKWRLNLEDLEKYSDVRLLSFGSLFGTDRVVTQSMEMRKWTEKLEKNQLPNVPVLKKISDDIAEQLGGRGKYIGLHLRVGNDLFRTQAPKAMPTVFRKLCHDILNLSKETIQELFERYEQTLHGITRNQRGAHYRRSLEQSVTKMHNVGDHLDLQHEGSPDHRHPYQAVTGKTAREFKPDYFDSAKHSFTGYEKPSQNLPLKSSQKPVERPSSKLWCRGKLYTEPHLQRLNTPIYIATDVSHPDQHPHLSIFFKTFPCVFTLKDFEVASLQSLHLMRSGRDGLKLEGFLYPMLEAMVASKGFGIVGTPRSTFSSYVTSALHPAFLSELSGSNRMN